MFKKTLLMISLFFLIFLPVHAREKLVFFIEDASYEDMLRFDSIGRVINNSVLGLSIQRKNTGDFSFFKGIKDKKPSSIGDKEVPLYSLPSEYKIYGNVLKDGTFYVPSKILLNGQSLRENKTSFIHVNNIEELNSCIEWITAKDVEIIISSWTRGRKYENYLLPVIFYDGHKKGIFYSSTTRNPGILDYENLNTLILKDSMEGLLIKNGDILKIYSNRIDSLKNKKTFLTLYGYFLGASAVINCILSRMNKNKAVAYLSTVAVMSPLGILLEPLFIMHNLGIKILIIIILSAFLSCYMLKYRRSIPFSIFLIMIYLDSFGYNYLLRNSLLSYEPSLGARFYGIGNEFLGIIIAYTFILIENINIKYKWALWGINSIFLLASFGGNNFGGFLTCAFMTLINSSLIIVLPLIIIAGIFVYNSQNHIGRFFKELIAGNYSYLNSIIGNKLATLKKLFSIGVWTRLSIVTIIIYIVEFFKGSFKFYGNAYQIVVCCIVVTITNDSGIVSMALLLGIYINYMFFNYCLGEYKWIT